MRCLLFIILFSACKIGLAQGNSEELFSKGLKRFELEKGVIHFTVKDQPKDTMLVVFDRFGWREVTIEFGKKKFYGMETSVNKRIIHDGTTQFTVNMLNKSGTQIKDELIAKLAGYKNPQELFEAEMDKLGATKTGTDAVIDKNCETWEFTVRGKPGKIWAWNGIELKRESPAGSWEAISIEESLTDGHLAFLEIPADISWK